MNKTINGRLVPEYKASASSFSLKEHLPALDGFRGLAILLVLLYHFFPFFRWGWMGVDLFFVLSGFLITGKLLQVRLEDASLYTYFRNRILRIVPAYFLVLAITYLGIWLIPEQKMTASMFQMIGILPYYGSLTFNIWCGFQGWPANIMLVHLWSVSTEIQFYLLWPLIIFLIPSYRKGIVVLLLIMCLALILRILPGEEIGLNNIYRYTFVFSRLDSFSAGALVFLALRRFGKDILLPSGKFLLIASGFALLICFLAFFPWHYSQQFVLTWGIFLNSIWWASLIGFVLLHRGNLVHSIFCYSALRWFGKYSYGMYIFHLPIWILCEKLVMAGFVPLWLAGILAVPVTMVAGYLSYHGVEKYFLSKKNHIAKS